MDFKALALFTADHAAVENGKVYVNGGFWDVLNQPSYPAQVSISLVAVISVPSKKITGLRWNWWMLTKSDCRSKSKATCGLELLPI